MIELENERRYLNQWGLNQRVQIDNFLPGTWVEFSLVNETRNTTLITEAYEETGHVFANIPNVLLQTFGYLHVYVNPPATDMVHTPEEKDFKIVRRQKPGYYIYTETPTVSNKNKVDSFWGTEYAGKALVVGEDGYVKASKKINEDDIVTGDDIGDMFVTDDEVGDMFDDVFESDENAGGGIDSEHVATDSEVNAMFADVFG